MTAPDPVDRPPPTGPRPTRPATSLQHFFGPSCLLSLVILLLLLIVIKRFVEVGWLGMAILAVVIWLAVLSILLRGIPRRLSDDE